MNHSAPVSKMPMANAAKAIPTTVAESSPSMITLCCDSVLPSIVSELPELPELFDVLSSSLESDDVPPGKNMKLDKTRTFHLFSFHVCNAIVVKTIPM